MSASADTLTNSSRVFYERTRTKIVMSIVIGAVACYLLGYCAVAGGTSSYHVSVNSLSYIFWSTFTLLLDGAVLLAS